MFGTGPRPQRLRAVEDFLKSGGETRAEAWSVAASEIEAVPDIHASSEYRRHVAANLVSFIIEESQAGGGLA